jgi:hypothetical protein
MILNDTKNAQYIYICECCDYISSKKSDLNRHFLSLKHKNKEMVSKNAQNAQNAQKSIFECDCGKKYKFKSGYYRHMKKCNYKIVENSGNTIEKSETNSIIEIDGENDMSYKSMIMTLIKENKEMRNIIVEQQKQVNELIPIVGNNNNNTVNNQKFNIQVFLNEKCKDALNMNDFIKSIEISLEQLDLTQKKGLSEGLSNAIMENMNKLSLYERPVHCTDIKRETLYIKDEDKWEKDKSKKKIREAIKNASSKNYKALQKWKTDNPDFLEDDSKKEFFSHVVSQIGKPVDAIDNKIIKNLCKETYIKDNIN